MTQEDKPQGDQDLAEVLTAPLRRWWGTQALAQSGNMGGRGSAQTIKNWTQVRGQCGLLAVLSRVATVRTPKDPEPHMSPKGP